MLPSIPPGKTFGRYRIGRVLGSGGMGTVYEARHVELDRRVALKALPRRFAEHSTVLERFVREGKAVARIEHPHVVAISDVGTAEGVPYLVMEYLEGESLGALLDREKSLSVQRTLDLLVPVVSAISAAHAAGIVHRDLKPDNVFLVRTPHGAPHPKVLDFGISKVDAEDGVTATGVMLGTPKYMSPEQALNSKQVGAATDQWSLGVMIYECITGRRPFEGESLFELLQRITDVDRPPMRELVPDVPEELERVVDRAMAREPAERFPSIASLGRALLPFASPETAATWSAAFEERAPVVITTASPKAKPDDAFVSPHGEEMKPRRSSAPTVSTDGEKEPIVIRMPRAAAASETLDETGARSALMTTKPEARAVGSRDTEASLPVARPVIADEARDDPHDDDARAADAGSRRERAARRGWPLAALGIVAIAGVLFAWTRATPPASPLVVGTDVPASDAPITDEPSAHATSDPAPSASPAAPHAASATTATAVTEPAAIPSATTAPAVTAPASAQPTTAQSATAAAAVRSARPSPTARASSSSAEGVARPPKPPASSTVGRYEIE